ncbi:hypothetical protein F5B20DRAFT_558723 [Whalleya microplaca]|nr:hypothetical protein F5B20DRAFT_558723 [Whalleya microplaca]
MPGVAKEGGASSSAIEDGSNRKTGGKGVKTHCKRYWWIHVLLLIIIIAVAVVPSVLLQAVPRTAQRKLDEASLTIDGIIISNTQTDSLNMAINSTITTGGDQRATIDGFEGTMHLADVDPPLAFAKINFPETTSDTLQTVNISQEVPITDLNAFTTFNKYLIERENVNILVKGDTHIHVKGISRTYPVAFRKTVPLKGLNGLAGLAVTNPQVNTDQYNNFNATVQIPNPSVLILDIGNTTFTNYFNGSDIGTVYILNLVLYPGVNDYFIWADIQQGPIVTALTQKPYCERNGTLPFQLAGKTVINNGQPIPYFADALKASNQSVDINIGQAIANDIGFPIGCLP